MLLSTSFNTDVDGEAPAGTTPLAISNGDFETGDTTGWSTSYGTLQVTGSRNGTTPNGGSYFGACNQSFSYIHAEIHHQVLDLVSDGVSTTSIDAGNVKIDLDWYQANDAASDKGCMLVQFLDASSVKIAPDYCDAEFEVTPEDTWAAQTLEAILPSGTRKVRIAMIGRSYAGSVVNVCFDDITAAAKANDLTPDTRTSALVVFRYSTASPPSDVNEAIGTTPSIANLKDQDGSNTGWGLATQAQAFTSTSNTGGTNYSRGFWYVSGYGALDTSAGTEYITLRISGLDTGKTYDISVFGSRFSSQSNSAYRDTDYDVGGTPVTLRATHNVTEVAEFTSVTPDGSGNIDLTAATNASATYGYLNAFKIWEN